MDEECSKPFLWSKLLLKDTKFIQNTSQIFEQLIDPRLIYIDEALNGDEFQTFIDHLVKSEYQLDMDRFSKGVFRDMERQSPQIFLHVTDTFDYKKIPGFLSIPYTFKHRDFNAFYNEHKLLLIDCNTFLN